MTDAEKAAADKAAKEAQALDEAAQKALAESRKAATALGAQRPPLDISGKASNPFNVRGVGFGDEPGTLEMSGRLVITTLWTDKVLKGYLPVDLKPGPVTVTRADGTEVQLGKFLG